MRLLRWLLPAVIVVVVAFVVSTYLEGLRLYNESGPSLPELLKANFSGCADDWSLTSNEGDNQPYEISAKQFCSMQDTDAAELEGLSIKLFHKDDRSVYDLVTTDHAVYDKNTKLLISEGLVEIILGVPADGSSAGKLLKIHSSAVQVNTETFVAYTQEHVSFEFDGGQGSAVGAYFDPGSGDLRLLDQVALDWGGAEEDSASMHIESGEGWYVEHEDKVIFYPWSRMKRPDRSGLLTLEGSISEIYLEDGAVRKVDVQQADGRHLFADRTLEFGGEFLHAYFDDAGTIEKMEAEHKARLISTESASRTSVYSERLDMDFVLASEDPEDGRVLNSAVATGASKIRIDPGADAKEKPDSKVLESDVIRVAMRDPGSAQGEGAEEIESLVTDGPGTLEFLPNNSINPKRRLEGDRIWIDFGDQNRVRQFRSTRVATLTEPSDPMAAATKTTSQDLVADFDALGVMTALRQKGDFRYDSVPRQDGEEPTHTESDEMTAKFAPTGELTRMEQTGQFRYRQGGNFARADHAVMDETSAEITLTGSARANDPGGSLAADQIVMDRETGDYVADGHVTATRTSSDSSPQDGTPLLSGGSEPLQATAKHMTSKESNTHLRFEGNAKAWQGANRVEAQVLIIDRQAQTLNAQGDVMTQLLDQSEENPAEAQAFTIVHAPDFVYDEANRFAHYTGGVVMERPGLRVDSDELRVWLNQGDDDASLKEAIADGNVEIVSTEPGQQPKHATSEHAQYVVDQQTVWLEGENAHMVIPDHDIDTKGEQIVWYMATDKVEVSAGKESTVRTKIGVE